MWDRFLNNCAWRCQHHFPEAEIAHNFIKKLREGIVGDEPAKLRSVQDISTGRMIEPN